MYPPGDHPAEGDDHTLRAMAQTRAMRNALRSCLGAALVLGGFDFADPEAPATKEQVGLLHQLERELGWSHEQGHAEAGEVDSYRDLNREEASLLIERWSALRDGVGEVAPSDRGGGVAPINRDSVAPSSPAASPTDVEGTAVSSSLSGGPPADGYPGGLQSDRYGEGRKPRDLRGIHR